MKKNKLSLASRNLKYKLKISFLLMSILPLLVSAYLVANFILPKVGFELGAVLSLAVSAVIALSGYLIIKELFDRILSVSTEAKLMAAGDLGRQMPIENMDELGDLGQALNQMTKRIRGNMDELKGYSEKTTEINFEIQKRVLMLSSLLQVSSLISQGAKLEDIFKLSVEKSRLLASSDTSYLLLKKESEEDFFVKVVDGINAQYILTEGTKVEEKLFRKVVYDRRPLVIDKENHLDQGEDQLFYEKFKIKNTLALPVYLKGKVVGVLGIGNNKDLFVYRNDDLELLDVFAKQVAISIENDVLTHRVEKLEIKDALTGLYNESFIHSRLQEEIRRSITYQRPCSFVLLNIDSFRKFHADFGSLIAEATLKKIAFLIRDSVGEIDRVGRVGDNEFAIVLPEKNKRQGQSVAEDIRRKIDYSFSEDPDQNKRLTVSGGVSENPLDGINAEELIIRAKSSLNLAKIQGKNRVMG